MAATCSSTLTSLSCMPTWVSNSQIFIRPSFSYFCNLKHSFYFLLTLCFFNHTGLAEKTQLLKLNVPATFMLVALDEGPGPPIKYQYAELGKLYTVVSQLVRCCDVSTRMQSSINGRCIRLLCEFYGDIDIIFLNKKTP